MKHKEKLKKLIKKTYISDNPSTPDEISIIKIIILALVIIVIVILSFAGLSLYRWEDFPFNPF